MYHKWVTNRSEMDRKLATSRLQVGNKGDDEKVYNL